jgi:16S rRNA (cytosine967-C5)-methyltransferase
MKASPRRIAVEILNRIDEKGGHAEPLLDEALSRTLFASPHDRGLLTELVYGTLRSRGRLDWIIGQLYHGRPETLETTVRNLLRTGLHQLWSAGRIPPFAVVHEAVEIAKEWSPAAAGLVNALLRTAIRKKESLPWPEMAHSPAEAIAVRHSHPLWLVRRLLAQCGPEETLAICCSNNQIPPLMLRVNTLKATRREAMAALAESGIAAEPTRYSLDGLVLSSPAAGLRDLSPYREGLLRIQDEASQLIAPLVGPRPGERILDLCAGAGGKTLHLVALMKNQGQVMAVDLRPEPLRGLGKEAKRLGISIVETRTGNAAAPFLGGGETFDRVLLDAPCSGLGTLRRNPEIRWRLNASDIRKSAKVQKALLNNAASCVRPGGCLVYSVCTVVPEENEGVVTDFLQQHPDFRLEPPENLPAILLDGRGSLRTFPHRHGMDGFFASRFIRAS